MMSSKNTLSLLKVGGYRFQKSLSVVSELLTTNDLQIR